MYLLLNVYVLDIITVWCQYLKIIRQIVKNKIIILIEDACKEVVSSK